MSVLRPGVPLPGSDFRGRLALILALAAGLRLGCYWTSSLDPRGRQLEEDSAGYLTLAANLESGAGFGRDVVIAHDRPHQWVPELCRTPAYPAVMALLRTATPDGLTSTILLQHGLGIFLCASVAGACRRLFGDGPALFAACLMAVDLQGIALSNLILTESLYGVTLFGVAVLSAKSWTRASVRLSALAGLLAGASALLRPTSIAMPILYGVCMLGVALAQRNRRRALCAFVLTLAGMATVQVWVTRNGVVAGEYILSSIPRYNLLFQHAAGALARDRDTSEESARKTLASAVALSEAHIRYLPLSAQENATVRREALETIAAHRKGFLKDYALRTTNTLFGPEKQILTVLGLQWVSFSDLVKQPTKGALAATLTLLVPQVLFVVFLAGLAMRGISLLMRGTPAPPLVWLSVAASTYVLALSSGSPGDPRLRWPVIPLLVMLAGGALVRFRDAEARRSQVPQGAFGPAKPSEGKCADKLPA